MLIAQKCFKPSTSCFGVGVIAFLMTVAIPALAAAQGKCTIALAKAEKEYLAGNFNTAIGLIDSCLKTPSLAKEEKMQAYELLALIQQSKGNEKQAKDFVKKMLKIESRYEPDLNDPKITPSYVTLVGQAKRSGGRKKWLWIGAGGAVASGITAFLLLRDGNGEEGFPLPPGRPTK